MKENKGNSIYCAHYASRYLPLTENWIYRILINHKKYTPVFLCRKKANVKLFPLAGIYSLGDFNQIRQIVELSIFRLIGYIPFFKSVCQEHHVKILHIHFGYHGVKMLGLKRALNTPMICSFYGDDAFSHAFTGKDGDHYSQLFKLSDKILALGPYMKQQLMKLGCDENKIAIHHLGIDADAIRFEKRTIHPKKPVRFLIASSFVKKKGIDLAIRALTVFKEKFNFSIDIIGDGPMKAEIMKEIEQGGLKDRIVLHGYQPYHALIDLMYQCDVFIQASLTTEDNRKEGTPMVIVDAMATGMAVIATRHSDIPEIVMDGITGHLAEENDVESLKMCIEKVLTQPDTIEQLGVKGRERVEHEFNARIQVERLERYYSELISGN